MKCTGCGQELGEGVRICPICKTQQGSRREVISERRVGSNEEMDSQVGKNINYEVSDDIRITFKTYSDKVEYPYSPRSRVTAGLLQIFFGGFGIGRFYLGYNGIALGQLFTCPLFFIGAIWGLIDGILILCGQVPYDANGVPLQ